MPRGRTAAWAIAIALSWTPVAAISGEPAEDSAPSASTEAVFSKYLARPDEPPPRFRARRRLEVTSGALGKSAWLEALVELSAPTEFRYQVLAAGGSRLLLERILHKVLRAEQEAYASGVDSRSAFTTDNYVLTPGGHAEGGLVRLLAKARRKDVCLLNGEMLLTPDNADLVEVSGTMAASPSFWTRNVQLRKRYARLLGHRLSVRIESVSRLRLLGESRLVMTAQYESIAGEAAPPVDFRQPH